MISGERASEEQEQEEQEKEGGAPWFSFSPKRYPLVVTRGSEIPPTPNFLINESRVSQSKCNSPKRLLVPGLPVVPRVPGAFR